MRELSLAGTAVTDEGIASLEALTRLNRLSLWRTHVTDACVPSLVKMAPREIVLIETDLTPAGVAALRRSLPDSEIDFETERDDQ